MIDYRWRCHFLLLIHINTQCLWSSPWKYIELSQVTEVPTLYNCWLLSIHISRSLLLHLHGHDDGWIQ
jgi:hypothetical protein